MVDSSAACAWFKLSSAWGRSAATPWATRGRPEDGSEDRPRDPGAPGCPAPAEPAGSWSGPALGARAGTGRNGLGHAPSWRVPIIRAVLVTARGAAASTVWFGHRPRPEDAGERVFLPGTRRTRSRVANSALGGTAARHRRPASSGPWTSTAGRPVRRDRPPATGPLLPFPATWPVRPGGQSPTLPWWKIRDGPAPAAHLPRGGCPTAQSGVTRRREARSSPGGPRSAC